jgi:hypothetical protein
MAQNKLHPFGSHRWVTIPFQTYQKIPFDILVDILFSVSRCLVMAQSLINSARKKADISATKLRTLLRETASQIDMWWSEGISGPNFEKRSASFSPNPANCTRDASSWSLCPFKKVDYYDLPTAALSALYDAANMIIFSLLFFVTPSGNTYEERIQLHAQSIISSYEFIHANNCPDPDRGSLMILLPLKVVSLWSPSQTLKIRASEIISSLSGNEGFSEVISNGLFKDVAAYVCSQQGGRADSAASLPSKGRGNRDMRDSKIILTAD